MDEYRLKTRIAFESTPPKAVDDIILARIRLQACRNRFAHKARNLFAHKAKSFALSIACSVAVFFTCICLLESYYHKPASDLLSLEQDSLIYLDMIGFSPDNSLYSFTGEDFSDESLINLL